MTGTSTASTNAIMPSMSITPPDPRNSISRARRCGRPRGEHVGVGALVSSRGARLDLFYSPPPLALNTGPALPQPQCIKTIIGFPFKRWPRHRQWDPARDTLATHLALVDE